MTLNEFKAFIEGMDIKTAPTADQWARICGKMAMVESEVRTETIKIIERADLPHEPSPQPWKPLWKPPYEITCDNQFTFTGGSNELSS